MFQSLSGKFKCWESHLHFQPAEAIVAYASGLAFAAVLWRCKNRSQKPKPRMKKSEEMNELNEIIKKSFEATQRFKDRCPRILCRQSEGASWWPACVGWSAPDALSLFFANLLILFLLLLFIIAFYMIFCLLSISEVLLILLIPFSFSCWDGFGVHEVHSPLKTLMFALLQWHCPHSLWNVPHASSSGNPERVGPGVRMMRLSNCTDLGIWIHAFGDGVMFSLLCTHWIAKCRGSRLHMTSRF